MAEDAVEAEFVEFTGCGRAVLRPVAGSAFPAGQGARAGFFLAAQLPGSPFEDTLVLLVCADDADIVDAEDAVDAMEEAEFCRWTVLRGPGAANILLTSSASIAAPI